MQNNIHRIDQTDHLPEAPARDNSARNIDAVVTSLIRLKGMFGAVAYLVNPDGTNTNHPSEYFEGWFADIQDRLDEAVSLLCKV